MNYLNQNIKETLQLTKFLTGSKFRNNLLYILRFLSFKSQLFSSWKISREKTTSKIGFSLLEVMLVLFIISVGFIFYLSLSQIAVLIGNVDHKTIAHQVASKKIESIKALTPQDWPQNGAFPDSLLNSLPQGQANLMISNFDPQGKLKKIQINVLWNERGAQKQYTLETLIHTP